MAREIHNLFRRRPGFESCQLKYTGRGNQVVAFATFFNHQSAMAALHALNGVKFDPQTGSVLHVELARSNSRRKRKGGGAYVVIDKRSKGEANVQGSSSDDVVRLLVVLTMLYQGTNIEGVVVVEATTNIVPQHWRPDSGTVMTNDVPNQFEAITPCVILSKNDSYVMSTSGGKISLFSMLTFEVITISMPPLPASFLAFHPQDNNIVAIGMQNSEIHLYYNKEEKVKHILKGHQKHITGLAFSRQLNILVSSSADAQLFFWSIDSWEKKKSLAIQMQVGNAPVGDIRVKFHINEVTLLVCHVTQLAIYDASKMELICQWIPHGLSSSISSATFSCNGQLVYASFIDGNIGVFDSDTLKLRCCIASSAYLHQFSSNSQNAYPLVVAAHPQEPNQFAIGLSDGSVMVVEPTESDGRWGY